MKWSRLDDLNEQLVRQNETLDLYRDAAISALVALRIGPDAQRRLIEMLISERSGSMSSGEVEALVAAVQIEADNRAAAWGVCDRGNPESGSPKTSDPSDGASPSVVDPRVDNAASCAVSVFIDADRANRQNFSLIEALKTQRASAPIERFVGEAGDSDPVGKAESVVAPTAEEDLDEFSNRFDREVKFRIRQEAAVDAGLRSLGEMRQLLRRLAPLPVPTAAPESTNALPRVLLRLVPVVLATVVTLALAIPVDFGPETKSFSRTLLFELGMALFTGVVVGVLLSEVTRRIEAHREALAEAEERRRTLLANVDGLMQSAISAHDSLITSNRSLEEQWAQADRTWLTVFAQTLEALRQRQVQQELSARLRYLQKRITEDPDPAPLELRGSVLVARNIEGLSFRGFDVIDGCPMQWARASRADFTEVTLKRLRATHSDLSYSSLGNANLEQVGLAHARLDASYAFGAAFVEVDLTEAWFRGVRAVSSTWLDVRFIRTRLSETVLSEARLFGSVFEDVEIESDIQAKDLVPDGPLVTTSLRSAELYGITWSGRGGRAVVGLDATGATFAERRFKEGADTSNPRMSEDRIRWRERKGSNQNVPLRPSGHSKGQLTQPSRFQSARFVRCSFRTATFDHVELTDVTFEGCDFTNAGFWDTSFNSCRFVDCVFDAIGMDEASHRTFQTCELQPAIVVIVGERPLEADPTESDILARCDPKLRGTTPEQWRRFYPSLERFLNDAAAQGRAYSNQYKLASDLAKVVRADGDGDALSGKQIDFVVNGLHMRHQNRSAGRGLDIAHLPSVDPTRLTAAHLSREIYEQLLFKLHEADKGIRSTTADDRSELERAIGLRDDLSLVPLDEPANAEGGSFPPNPAEAANPTSARP